MLLVFFFLLFVSGGVSLVEQLFFMLASNPRAVDIEYFFCILKFQSFHCQSQFQFFPFPSATLTEHNRSSSSSTTDLPGCRISQSLLGHQTDSGSTSPSSPDFTISTLCKSGVKAAPSGSTSTLSCFSRPQSQWISFADELLTIRHTSTDKKEPQRLHFKTENACLASSALLGNSSNSCASEDQSDLFNNSICHEQLFIEETGTAAEISSASSSALLDYSLVSSCAHTNEGMPSMHSVLLFANN